jgi:hypothetical protein
VLGREDEGVSKCFRWQGHALLVNGDGAGRRKRTGDSSAGYHDVTGSVGHRESDVFDEF